MLNDVGVQLHFLWTLHAFTFHRIILASNLACSKAAEASAVERPVKRRAAHVQKAGHILAGFAFVDQLPGVVDLIRCELRFPAKLHASALRRLYSGACAL